MTGHHPWPPMRRREAGEVHTHLWVLTIWNEQTGEASCEVVTSSGVAHDRANTLRRAGRVVDVKARLRRERRAE